MKHNVMLTIASLLSILFGTFHLADDIVRGGIANSSGGFFFVWTLIAIGVTGLFSVIVSARGLWSLPWRRPR